MTPSPKKGMKRVRVPILNDEYAVYVVWGDENTVKRWIHWYFDDKSMFIDADHYRGITLGRQGYMPVIYMNVKTDHEFFGTLSHEAVHAVDRIFKYIGDEYSRDELFAHSVGAVVRLASKKYIKSIRL